MRWMLIALAVVSSHAAHGAPDHQVAVILGSGLGAERSVTDESGVSRRIFELSRHHRRVLEALELALEASPEPIALALLACPPRGSDPPSELEMARAFSAGAKGLTDLIAALVSSQDRFCSVDADRVDAALDQLKWAPDSERRILVLGRAGSTLGSRQRSVEQVMHRAEREGVVVHALELVVESGRPREWLFPETPEDIDTLLGEDIEAFLRHPTRPLGRIPRLARHAVTLTGGTYFLWAPAAEETVSAYDSYARGDLRPRSHRVLRPAVEHAVSLLARAYGPDLKSRDALHDLAFGLRRPSEVSPSELPTELRDIDLEPLLDAVWDYVDARRVYAATMKTLFGGDLPLPALQRLLEQQVVAPLLAPPRKMPSVR